MPVEYLTASDGLIARKQKIYAKAKLEFLDYFIPPALNATTGKMDRVYLDLFAGPGLNIDPDTGEEFEGSPLRASFLRGTSAVAGGFTRAVLCNFVSIEHEALEIRTAIRARASSAVTPRVECRAGDSNAMLPEILATIHPRAYLLVFADLEGITQLPWTTVQQLRRRHESVDLYVLLPIEMSFNRLLGTNRDHRQKHEHILTAFYGSEAWRPIVEDWSTDAQGPAKRDALERLYLQQLRAHWKHVDVVEVARMAGDRLLYRMVFATNDDAGRRIAKWTKRRPRNNQFGLDLG